MTKQFLNMNEQTIMSALFDWQQYRKTEVIKQKNKKQLFYLNSKNILSYPRKFNKNFTAIICGFLTNQFASLGL